MDQTITQYMQAREYIISILPYRIDTFLVGMYDPVSKFNLIKHTTELIKTEVEEMFPMFPADFLPSFRFRIHDEYNEVEVGVQYFYNTQHGLTYLGTTDIQSELFDFYVRDSYDPQFDFRLIVRYGSESDDYLSGCKTAAAQYYLGQQTPLAFAYALALEDGFIG